MTKPPAPIVGRIVPGPKGTRIIVDENDGGLSIEIQGQPTPTPSEKPDAPQG